MNYALKAVIEKAIYMPELSDTLDIIYTKLIVIPFQKAWRSKSSEQRLAFGQSMRLKKRRCLDCKTEYMCPKQRDFCTDCYYQYKYRLDYED